ncbi:MAG: hypothetical protein LBB93_05655 [Elusimicrobiota bacterium]|jgi:hypothetical protein|nr:hypothetical protein [Elusimicrobiota bacterium]
MKKVFFALIAAIIAANVASAQVLDGNLIGKVGLDIAGKFNSDKYLPHEDSNHFNTASGLEIAGEYTLSVANIVSVGGGLKYVFGKDIIDIDRDGTGKAAYLPAYFLVNVKPFFTPGLSSLYFLANLGWNLYADLDLSRRYDQKVTTYGRTYLAFGVGYELPFGLLFEAVYNIYNAETTFQGGDSSTIFTSYHNVSFIAGYKF